MKKLILAMVIIAAVSANSYAIGGFLTASGIGLQKFDIMAYGGGQHMGSGYNSEGTSHTDVSLGGVRLLYGLFSNVDLFLSYSDNTLPNQAYLADDYLQFVGGSLPAGDVVNLKLQQGYSTFAGVKWTLGEFADYLPLNTAVYAGVGSDSSQFELSDTMNTNTVRFTNFDSFWTIGGIISKKIGDLVPYASLDYRSIQTYDSKFQLLNTFATYDDYNTYGMLETGVDITYGFKFWIAKDLAVAFEGYSENVSWPDNRDKAGNVTYAGSYTLSGGNAGIEYLF